MNKDPDHPKYHSRDRLAHRDQKHTENYYEKLSLSIEYWSLKILISRKEKLLANSNKVDINFQLYFAVQNSFLNFQIKIKTSKH